MKTLIEALTSNTITIVATLLLIAFLAYLFKNQIENYLKNKYNLFSEREVIDFVESESRTHLSAYALKNKLDLFKYKLKNHKNAKQK